MPNSSSGVEGFLSQDAGSDPVTHSCLHNSPTTFISGHQSIRWEETQPNKTQKLSIWESYLSKCRSWMVYSTKFAEVWCYLAKSCLPPSVTTPSRLITTISVEIFARLRKDFWLLHVFVVSAGSWVTRRREVEDNVTDLWFHNESDASSSQTMKGNVLHKRRHEIVSVM